MGEAIRVPGVVEPTGAAAQSSPRRAASTESTSRRVHGLPTPRSDRCRLFFSVPRSFRFHHPRGGLDPPTPAELGLAQPALIIRRQIPCPIRHRTPAAQPSRRRDAVQNVLRRARTPISRDGRPRSFSATPALSGGSRLEPTDRAACSSERGTSRPGTLRLPPSRHRRRSRRLECRDPDPRSGGWLG